MKRKPNRKCKIYRNTVGSLQQFVIKQNKLNISQLPGWLKRSHLGSTPEAGASNSPKTVAYTGLFSSPAKPSNLSSFFNSPHMVLWPISLTLYNKGTSQIHMKYNLAGSVH